MKKIQSRKKLLWVIRVPLYFLLGIMLLLGTGVLLLQTGLVRDRLCTFLIEAANKQLNATVGIQRIRGNFLSGVSIEGISVNTPENQPVLFIEKVSARYFLPMVLAKVVYVNNVRIKGLRLDMIKLPNGKWNFSTFLKPSDKTEESSPASAGFPFLVVVKRFEIADALLALKESDQGSTATRSLQIDRFAAGVEYGETLQLSILESSMTFNTPEALSVAMTGKAVFDPETTGIIIDNLIIQSGPSTINVGGDCRFQEKIPVFDCAIGLDGVDLGDIGRRLLISSLPEGAVSGTITVSGTPADVRHRVFLKQEGTVLEINGSTGFDDTQGFWTDLSGSVRTFELSKLRIPFTEHLSGVVSTDISLTGTGLQKPETMQAGASIAIRGVLAAGIPLDVIRLNADWSHRKVAIDQLEIVSGEDRLGLSGSIKPFDRSTGLDLTVHLEKPEVLLDRLSKHLSQTPATLALKGKTDITAAISGWLDNPHARISIHAGEVTFDRIRAKIVDLTGNWQGIPGPENRIDDLRFTAQDMGLDEIGAGTFLFTGSWLGWIDNPSVRISIKARNVTGDRLNIELLDITSALQGMPSADDSRADLRITAGGVRMDRIKTGTLSLSGSWRGPLSRYAGHAELDAHEIDIQNNLFDDLFLTADVTPAEATISVSGKHENGSGFEVDGKAAPWTTPEKDITIGKLRMVTLSPWPESTLTNSEPVRFSIFGDKGIEVHACRLEINDTKVSINGNLAATGDQDVNLVIDKLELRDIPGKWNTDAKLSGTVSAETSIQGTLDRPIISAHLNLQNLVGYGITQATELNAAVDYASETATLQATLLKKDTPILSAKGNAPVRLSLMPFSMLEVAGNMEATLETRELRFSELPIPRINGVAWDAVADMNLFVSGNIRKPDFSGNIAIHDGYLTLTKNKLTYEHLNGNLSLSNNRVLVEELMIAGEREGRLTASGTITIGDNKQLDTDLTLDGDNFYIPFQKAVSARISPKLHLTGGRKNPKLLGEVTITESRINLDRLAEQQYSDIQVVETASEGGDAPLNVAPEPQGSNYLSPLTADILVRVPRNAWLKGQDVNAEIAGEIAIKKKPGGAFLLSGPLNTVRGNYYFMGKNFRLTKGNVEFLGLKEINPNLNIEAQTRIKSVTVIVTLHGTAREIAIDLSSDPVMDESDIISYLVFGRAPDSIGGNQAFNVEKAALGYTGGLLAAELRNLLGDVFFIDSFAIDSGSNENGFGSVTLGKYVTPEIFISHRQGLSENEPSFEEITYELTPQIKLETQIGRENANSADLTWEFDF